MIARMDAQAPNQSYVERLEYVVRQQMSEISELRAENKRLLDWITGDADALTTLQAIYGNPTAPEGNRIKAAASALPFERPKLSVSVSVQGPAILGNRLDAMKAINPPNIIDQQP